MPTGRPRIIQSPEEYEERAEAYFAQCRADEEPLTITGLALALGFCDRQSLYDYEKRPEFSAIARRARLVVENGYEHRMHGNAPTGAIFVLKNMGWSDRQELEHSGPGGGPISVTRRVVDPAGEDAA